jgi:transposase
VRRYLREGAAAETQTRPGAWTLDGEQREAARGLLDGAAAGNVVVVRRLLAEQNVEVPLRTLQRVLAPHCQAKRAAELATVRFETAPGQQMQIDFGEKWILIAGNRTKVHLFVAVLGYSRRIFVRPSLSQRQDDWREGLAGAFRTFGGVTQHILIDGAGALVIGQDRETCSARAHPAFAEFCKDRGVAVSACRLYRVRTKGKTESGVGYVKRNAIAGLSFVSFAALEAHLVGWMVEADRRIHGTTHERPVNVSAGKSGMRCGHCRRPPCPYASGASPTFYTLVERPQSSTTLIRRATCSKPCAPPTAARSCYPGSCRACPAPRVSRAYRTLGDRISRGGYESAISNVRKAREGYPPNQIFRAVVRIDRVPLTTLRAGDGIEVDCPTHAVR